MQRSLVELRERLLRKGIARRHVERYLAELADHFADLRTEEERGGRSGQAADIAATERLGTMETLATAMLAKPELRAWSSRLPWAVFGVGPVILLYALYLVACLILWAGWKAFLPQAETPFVAGSQGFANLYFQAGKYYYCAAPVLAAWWIEFIAVRQRVKVIWMTISLLLVAWTGAAAQIHASRANVHSALGHISIDFDYCSLIRNLRNGMPHVTAILVFASLPYLLWRFQKATSSVA
jgi:hypothetical protein